MIRVRTRLAVAGAGALLALSGSGIVLAANRASAPATASHPAVSTESTATVSATPAASATPNFGSQVKAQVATCKAARPASGGKQGIGECVSDWVVANNPGHTGKHAGH